MYQAYHAFAYSRMVCGPQTKKRCMAAIENMGPIEGVQGTFPWDAPVKLMCKWRAIEPVLSEIVEQTSKMHHSIA